MLLRDIAEKLWDPGRVDPESVLPENLHVHEITRDLLASCKEMVYLLDRDGACGYRIRRELLEYLSFQQRKDMFTQLLDSVRDGIIAVDAAGRVFYLNQAYTDILNVKPYKIIGKYIQQVEPDSLLTRALTTRKPAESPAKRIASVNKYVSLRIFPLFSGEVFAGAVSIFQDVTELHALDREVKKMTSIVGEYSDQLNSLTTVRNMGILTQERTYLNVLDQAAVVARTDVPVLIRGENGVGKEVLANYIHQCSGRKGAPLITVNCAAIPAELLESELFGYEEGAFTGALKGGKKGKFELADKGTIFLDEIGDMPLTMQSKLLRVIQQGEIEKLGRQRNLRVDVRILAATNQPLEQMIAEKSFRQDLFFRLNVFTLQIPPLRERPGDVVLLTDYFLKHFNHKYGKDMRLSSGVYLHLQQQRWPGNTRELQGCIERAVILEDESLLLHGLPDPQRQAGPETADAPLPRGPLRELLRAYERRLLQQALADAAGKRGKAMEQLGLSRRTFYRKCAEHGLLGGGECQK